MAFSVEKRTGSLTAQDQAVTLHKPNTSTCVFQLAGTWAATVTFEISVDGTNFVATSAINANTGTGATTTTGTGIYCLNASCVLQVRARCSAYTSGTIVVTALLGDGTPPVVAGGAASTVDTELPTAVVLNDANITDAAATGPFVGALAYVYDAGLAKWVRNRKMGDLSDGNGGGTYSPVGPVGFNGSTFDRLRTAVGGQDLASGTGVLGATPMVKAVAHGSNPTAFTAGRFGAALSNIAGIPFWIGGHPNIITRIDSYTSAQTNAAIVTVSAGTLIVVTQCTVLCDKANTANTTVRIGFGTASTPALNSVGLVVGHPGADPGGGVGVGDGSAIVGVGASDEDLRITSSDPGGTFYVLTKYFTITG